MSPVVRNPGAPAGGPFVCKAQYDTAIKAWVARHDADYELFSARSDFLEKWIGLGAATVSAVVALASIPATAGASTPVAAPASDLAVTAAAAAAVAVLPYASAAGGSGAADKIAKAHQAATSADKTFKNAKTALCECLNPDAPDEVDPDLAQQVDALRAQRMQAAIDASNAERERFLQDLVALGAIDAEEHDEVDALIGGSFIR